MRQTSHLHIALGLLLYLLLLPHRLGAQGGATSPEELYSNAQWSRALTLYQSELSTEGESSELYYNMANCYYQLDSLGQAVLYYQRALWLNPRNHDARHNLSVAMSKTEDGLQETPYTHSSSLLSTIDTVVYTLPIYIWMLLGLLAFGASIYAFVQFRLRRRARLKRIAFFASLSLLVVSLACNLALAHLYHYHAALEHLGVVIPSVVETHTQGTEVSPTKVLHAGSVVKLGQQEGRWQQITILASGEQTSLPVSALQPVVQP